MKAGPAEPRGSWFASVAIGGLGIWLGWQVLSAAVASRAPSNIALSVASLSPSVLARSAETAFAAEEYDAADILARDALVRAPFSVKALRVIGLVQARRGDLDAADQTLTLAGNWSLRDDPTHAWLVQHRLSRGDYGSAFAHADTLARRRDDLQPRLFNLFSTAAEVDPRAVPHLAKLLVVRPPWRGSYLGGLYVTEKKPALAATLAVVLEPTRGRFSAGELSELYQQIMWAGQPALLLETRRLLKRPDPAQGIVDGDFQNRTALLPFAWKVNAVAGLTAEIINESADTDDFALRAEYEGIGNPVVVEQLTTLAPGPYRLATRARGEQGGRPAGFIWFMRCFESGAEAGRLNVRSGNDGAWRTSSTGITIPSSGCRLQRLTLEATPTEDGGMSSVWIGEIAATPAGAGRGS